MNKYFEHFKTISKHKFVVMKLCFRCGQYRRGLMHDNSKFGLTEFFSSARYFQGTRSPIDAEKEAIGYSIAWQHHKGHNPHHWEYWIDNVGTRQNDAIKIPYKYVVEMICDWVGAGIIYSKQNPNYNSSYTDPLDYYNKWLPKRIFNSETQKLIEYFLNEIAINGINSFCKKAKSKTLKQNYIDNNICQKDNL